MLDYNSMRVMYNMCHTLVPNKKIKSYTKASLTFDAFNNLVNTMSILDSVDYVLVGASAMQHLASIIPDNDARYCWSPQKVVIQTGLTCVGANDLKICTDAHFQRLGSSAEDTRFISDNEFILIGAQGSVSFGQINLNV